MTSSSRIRHDSAQVMWSNQQNQLFRALLSVIYQTNLPATQWLARVSNALSQLLHFDQGLGVFGYFARSAPGEPTEAMEWGGEPGLDMQPFIHSFYKYQKSADLIVQFGMHSNLICGYATELVPKWFEKEKKLVAHVAPAPHARDCFGINALGPDGLGPLFASYEDSDHPHKLSQTTRAMLRELAYHMIVAGHLVRRPRDMTLLEAFTDFQKQTLHSFVITPALQRFSDLGRTALEELAFMADQQGSETQRLSSLAAQNLFTQLQQGGLIIQHRFERMNAVFWVVQLPIPLLQPRIPFTAEEQALFTAYAKWDSLKQALDDLPRKRSLAYGYQLLRRIAAKLSRPEATPEELLPLAKVWLAATEDQPSRFIRPKPTQQKEVPNGLRATLFSVGDEVCYVVRFLEELRELSPGTTLPRSALKLVTDALAGKSPEQIAQKHGLATATVMRRLSTARRLGLLTVLSS